MPKEPVWTRAYLKSIGAQDDQVDYQNGAVTYKGKPFQHTTPSADGKAYGSQSELDGANFRYQASNALDQYKTNINKPVTPFSYDMNSIKSDPLYTSGLQSLQNDAQTATNQSLVNLGRRGIGNSQSAVTSANAQQQNVVNQANTKLAPQVIAQKYQQYLDTNAQQEKQNQNLLGLANAQFGQAQQGFNNDRLTNQDTFNNGLAMRQDARAEGQMTGNYMPPGAKESISTILGLKRQAEQDGVTTEQMAQFKATADAERAKLFRMGVDPNVVGFDDNYDQASQDAANYRGIPTLQGQGQAFNQNLATRDQTLQETQVGAQLTGKLPDGTPTYASGQDAMRNTAQYAGMYNGQPTMQKIMQDATIQNMTSDNLRQAEAEARATGNNQLAKRFEIWDRTGTAPDGIPGVAAGTPLGGKKSTAQTAETYSKYLDGVAKYDKDKTLTNPQQVEDAIILSGLNDYEQYRLYKQHGLKWDDPIPTPGK